MASAVPSADNTSPSEDNDNTFSLRVSDGTTHILAILQERVWTEFNNNMTQLSGIPLTRGCVVLLTDWCVHPATTCAQAPQVHVALLVSGSLQLLGGQGLGIVGEPVDVHAAVDVRRALDSIGFSQNVLEERLMFPNSNAAAAVMPAATATITTTDLPVGDVAALLGSNEAFWQASARVNASTGEGTDMDIDEQHKVVAAAARKQPPAAAASRQFPFANATTTAFSPPGSNRGLDLATTAATSNEVALPGSLTATTASTTTTTTADITAMHELFSNVIDAANKAQGARVTNANEESPRKEAAPAQTSVHEVMTPDASDGPNAEEDEEDDDDDNDNDEDQPTMGISDMLISQEDDNTHGLESPVMEQQDETQNEALVVETQDDDDDDDELDQGFETQQAAPLDLQEDRNTQSNNDAEIAAAPDTTTTTATQRHANSPSRKRRRHVYDQQQQQHVEWVNMDLVELGVVAVPRTADTPMLTMEKLWRHMASSIPTKQPLRRTESTTGLGGDIIRALLLGGSD
jgi:hypothetical protein